MTNIQLITHSDLDGAGCAAILQRMFKDTHLDINFCNYDTVDSEIDLLFKEGFFDKDSLLLITDICPEKATCQKLNKYKNKVLLVDHHKTRNWVKKFDWAIFDEGYSATRLVYRQLFALLFDRQYLKQQEDPIKDKRSSGMDTFTSAVDAWDMWRLSSEYRERGENLNTLCFFLGLEEFVKEFAKDLYSDRYSSFIKIIKHLKKNKEKYVAEIINNQLHETPYQMDDYGHTFKILFCDRYVSEIGHAALNDEDSQDLWYVVIINPTKNVISLRTKVPNRIDVSKIARKFGGGGHPAAAGFQLDLKKRLRDFVFKKLNLMDS